MPSRGFTRGLVGDGTSGCVPSLVPVVPTDGQQSQQRDRQHRTIVAARHAGADQHAREQSRRAGQSRQYHELENAHARETRRVAQEVLREARQQEQQEHRRPAPGARQRAVDFRKPIPPDEALQRGPTYHAGEPEVERRSERDAYGGLEDPPPCAEHVSGGTWRGFLYSAIGITLGSTFNFWFARVVGRPTLERLIGRDRLTKIDRALASARSRSAMFLLFLLPGFPKDFLCYAAGLSGMRILEFVVLSALARSPALLASVLIGAGVSRGDYRSVLAIALLTLLAIGGYYWYERRNAS